MANASIVTVNASVVQAPAPLHLQQTGALVTQGGSNTIRGALTLVSTLAELQNILAAAINITTLAWASNVVTVTTATAHGWTNGDVIPIVISGALPAGFNGSF